MYIWGLKFESMNHFHICRPVFKRTHLKMWKVVLKVQRRGKCGVVTMIEANLVKLKIFFSVMSQNNLIKWALFLFVQNIMNILVEKFVFHSWAEIGDIYWIRPWHIPGPFRPTLSDFSCKLWNDWLSILIKDDAIKRDPGCKIWHSKVHALTYFKVNVHKVPFS